MKNYILILILFASLELNSARNLTINHLGNHNLKSKIAKITGGYAAEPGQFPFFVHLLVETEEGTFICSGSLLTSELVLTAAHCCENYKKIQLAATHIGYRDWKKEGVKVYTDKKVCVSPYYVANGAFKFFDYAIIRLDEPVKFSDSVRPISLPDLPIGKDTPAYVLGVGFTYKLGDKAVFANSLNVLPVKKGNCTKYDLHPTHICFGSYRPEFRGKTCGGDSGGPIVAEVDGRVQVFGINSYGVRLCYPGYMAKGGDSIAADIYNQVDHIKDLMRECIT